MNQTKNSSLNKEKSRKRVDNSAVDRQSDMVFERKSDEKCEEVKRSSSVIMRIWKGRVVRHCLYRNAGLLTCLFIILFPVSCMYIGYTLSLTLAPSSLSRRFPDVDVVVDTSRLNYSHYKSHNITIEFIGGLGNQMFQYASLYGISRANGLLPVVDTKAAVSRMFHSALRATQVSSDELHKRGSFSLFVERRSNSFDQRTLSINFMRNIRLDGYFQSWRYFDHVQKDIRQQFAFRSSIYREVSAFLTRARRKHQESSDAAIPSSDIRFVGVHIRRGDFMDDVNVEKGYTTADAEYLEKAVKYFEKRHQDVVFIVCSDDLPWSRENFHTTTGTTVFSEYESAPFHDLCLLSLCNDTIITVGTFGWWGAWLAGGETIYYRQYPRLGSTLRDNFKMADYYLPSWIAMS